MYYIMQIFVCTITLCVHEERAVPREDGQQPEARVPAEYLEERAPSSEIEAIRLNERGDSVG